MASVTYPQLLETLQRLEPSQAGSIVRDAFVFSSNFKGIYVVSVLGYSGIVSFDFFVRHIKKLAPDLEPNLQRLEQMRLQIEVQSSSRRTPPSAFLSSAPRALGWFNRMPAVSGAIPFIRTGSPVKRVVEDPSDKGHVQKRKTPEPRSPEPRLGLGWYNRGCTDVKTKNAGLAPYLALEQGQDSPREVQGRASFHPPEAPKATQNALEELERLKRDLAVECFVSYVQAPPRVTPLARELSVNSVHASSLPVFSEDGEQEEMASLFSPLRAKSCMTPIPVGGADGRRSH